MLAMYKQHKTQKLLKVIFDNNTEYGIKAVMTCAKGYHKNIPRSRL